MIPFKTVSTTLVLSSGARRSSSGSEGEKGCLVVKIVIRFWASSDWLGWRNVLLSGFVVNGLWSWCCLENRW